MCAAPVGLGGFFLVVFFGGRSACHAQESLADGGLGTQPAD
jgi:hypothetical protein